MLYIKLIIQHLMILSGTQRNLTIYFLYKCSPYTSNINVQNYHSFWSYDKNFLSLNPKYDYYFSYLGGGGPGGLLRRTYGCQNFRGIRLHHRADIITRDKITPSFSYMGHNVKKNHYWLFGGPWVALQ